MDPLSVLALASNVLQLLEYSTKVCKKGRELYRTGSTEDIEHLEFIASDLTAVCADIEHAQPKKTEIGVCERADAPAAKVEQRLEQANAELQQRETVEQDTDALGDLARRAEEAAQDLVALLKRLNVSDAADTADSPTMKQRRVTTVKRAFKFAWNEKEIEHLQSRVRDLQQALTLRLVALQRTSCSAVLSGFDPNRTDFSKNRLGREARYEDVLCSQVLDRESGADASTLNNAIKARCESLSACSHTVTLAQRVLASLSFDQIHSRELAVAESHARTCEWIYDNKASRFVHWATQQDGTFWITGKPGSGKSTLMKHLVKNTRTKDLLAKWASPARIVIAYHFFWHAGIDLQNRELGLLRTLAYYVVQQSPDSAMRFVPKRFTASDRQCNIPKSSPCSDNRCDLHKLPTWSSAELRGLILGFAAECSTEAKICFFIDGLDEYAGEHTELIELLATLSGSSSVKMCVSGRPWNTLTRAYDGQVDGQLAVQDLTADDMAIYVRDHTTYSPLFRQLRIGDPEGYEELMRGIKERAQGVFLWVSLVLRSLLRGLTNDDDLDTLKTRLSEFPDELNGLYKHIFDRIEKVYRKHSARILLAAGCTGSLPLRAPLCMELELAFPDYARSLSLQRRTKASSHVPVCTTSPCFQKKCLSCWIDHLLALQSVRSLINKITLCRHLDARCADFLELSNDEIIFIHRTASDYLKREASGELTDRAGKDFDVGISLTRVYYTGFVADHAAHWLEKQQLINGLVHPCNVAECEFMRQGWQGRISGAMYTDGRPLSPLPSRDITRDDLVYR